MTGPLTVDLGNYRGVRVSPFKDEPGCRIAVQNSIGNSTSLSLTPEQAGELVTALRESGACVPRQAVPASAADLPEGSIVATADTAWIKTVDDAWGWLGTDADADAELAVTVALAQGATVLRVGQGGA